MPTFYVSAGKWPHDSALLLSWYILVTKASPHLCFSSGREGSTQRPSLSELPLDVEAPSRVGGEDLRIFWVQLFCLRCCWGWAGGCWGCLVSVGWGVSSLAGRSRLSNCAGGEKSRKRRKEFMPGFELDVEASSKYKIRMQSFDVSCKMLFSMLSACAAYKI